MRRKTVSKRPRRQGKLRGNREALNVWKRSGRQERHGEAGAGAQVPRASGGGRGRTGEDAQILIVRTQVPALNGVETRSGTDPPLHTQLTGTTEPESPSPRLDLK